MSHSAARTRAHFKDAMLACRQASPWFDHMTTWLGLLGLQDHRWARTVAEDVAPESSKHNDVPASLARKRLPGGREQGVGCIL